MKVAEVLRILGWYRTGGMGAGPAEEPRQFRHPKRPGRVTFAGKASDGLAPGALESVLKQSGYRVGDLHSQ
jgi:predicted RNA binding protein YcfA (HicA-like mRNA interferase family)